MLNSFDRQRTQNAVLSCVLLASLTLMLGCSGVEPLEFTSQDGAIPHNTDAPTHSEILPPSDFLTSQEGWIELPTSEKGVNLDLVMAGDVLEITVYNFVAIEEMLSGEFHVGPDSAIVFGFIGSVKVGGKDTTEIREALELRLEGVLKKSVVAVSIKSYAPRTATVLSTFATGDQAIVDLSSSRTLLEVLVAAGWNPATDVSDSITIRRDGRKRTISLRALVESRVESNIEIDPGDIIIAHSAKSITVIGSVASPISFPAGIDHKISIFEAIVRAGGMNMDANPNKVKIIAEDGTTNVINMAEVLSGDHNIQHPFIYAGQTMIVPEAERFIYYAFGMTGVNGAYESDNQLTITQLLALAGVEKFGADIDDARLLRGWPNDPVAYSVDVEKILDGDATMNVLLKNGDVLFLPETGLSDAIRTFTKIMQPITGGTAATAGIFRSVNDVSTLGKAHR